MAVEVRHETFSGADLIAGDQVFRFEQDITCVDDWREMAETTEGSRHIYRVNFGHVTFGPSRWVHVGEVPPPPRHRVWDWLDEMSA
jgi:hypothetical protein